MFEADGRPHALATLVRFTPASPRCCIAHSCAGSGVTTGRRRHSLSTTACALCSPARGATTKHVRTCA